MTDFQPMSTAPKDGTDVILKTNVGKFIVAKLDDPAPCDEIPAYYCDSCEAWISSGHWTDRQTEFGDDTPTYVISPVGWMLAA